MAAVFLLTFAAVPLHIIPDRRPSATFLPTRLSSDGQPLIIASPQQQMTLRRDAACFLHLLRSHPGSGRGGLAGLARENLQPDATIRYVAQA